MRDSLIFALAAVILASGCDADSMKGQKFELKEKIVCTGVDEGSLTKVKLHATDAQIKKWGEAFEASGNCNAKLVDSDIKSPTVAIRAGGNTKLVIEGGRVEGGKHALIVAGNAQIEIKGAEIVGKVKTGGNGKILGLEDKKPDDKKTDDKKTDDKKTDDKKPDDKKTDDKKTDDKKEEGGW